MLYIDNFLINIMIDAISISNIWKKAGQSWPCLFIWKYTKDAGGGGQEKNTPAEAAASTLNLILK